MDIPKLHLKADEWWSLKKGMESNSEDCRIIVNDTSNYLMDYNPDLTDASDIVVDLMLAEDVDCHIKILMKNGKCLLAPFENWRGYSIFAQKAIGQVTSPNQIINKWRHYNNGEVCEPPKKKMKSKRNPEAKAMLAGYHANIKQCFVGVFSMKIDCLVPANDTRMVRMQDGDFVKSLTARMLSKRSICIDSAPPVIGLIDKNICPSKSSFSDDLLERGAIEVIDGNHSVLAQKAAFEATKEKVFEKRLVAVYAGLTDQQALSLGVSKNQDACHVLKMTPIEEIKLFRRELYYTNNIPLTEEPPLPTSLYYSTIKHILGISTKSAMDSKRMAIKLASLSKRCFVILEALMKEKPGLKAYKFQALQGIAEENDIFKCLQRFQRDGHDEFLVKCSEIKGTINTTQSNHHKLEVHVTPQTIHVTKLHHANTATITLNGKSREWKADELFQALTDYTRNEAMDLEGSGPLESSILSGIGDEEEEESSESDNDSHVDTGRMSELMEVEPLAVSRSPAKKSKEPAPAGPSVSRRITRQSPKKPGPTITIEDDPYEFDNTDDDGEYKIIDDLSDLKVGDNILIDPPPKQKKTDEPWLGKVTRITKRKIFFEFFLGSYTTSWEIGVYGEDSVLPKQVVCIVQWDEKLPMPNGLVQALKKMLD